MKAILKVIKTRPAQNRANIPVISGHLAVFWISLKTDATASIPSWSLSVSWTQQIVLSHWPSVLQTEQMQLPHPFLCNVLQPTYQSQSCDSPLTVLGKKIFTAAEFRGFLQTAKLKNSLRETNEEHNSFIVVPSAWWLGVLEFITTKYTSWSLHFFVYEHRHTHIYVHILVFIFFNISVINKSFIFILNCTSRLSLEWYESSVVVYNSSGKVTLHLIKSSMCLEDVPEPEFYCKVRTAVPLYDSLFLFIKTIKPSVHLSTLFLKLSWVSMSSTSIQFFNSLAAIK